jgi:alpha-L-rhamnosidase
VSLLSEDGADLWNSGRVASDASVHVAYEGAPLPSRQACYWKVRIWDEKGNASAWSDPARWTTGLLDEAEWEAQWIGLDSGLEPKPPMPGNWIWFPGGEPHVSAPVGERWFRKTFDLPEEAEVASAAAWMLADNSYALFVNGTKAGEGANSRAAEDLDITDLLKPGENVLSVSAKNGGDNPNPAGLLAAFSIAVTGGSTVDIVTDDSWKASEIEVPDWKSPSFDDSSWTQAQVLGANGIAPWNEIPEPGAPSLPARYLRREFETASPVKRATAYICGLGLYELYVNGHRIGDHVLAPACSEYDKRVFYVTYDVTDTIRDGHNAIGVARVHHHGRRRDA